MKVAETGFQLALITLLVSSSVGPRMQGPTEPVWVPQNPPFGTIATLVDHPELPSILPMAGPTLTDVRVADFGGGFWQWPGKYLRLRRIGDRIDARLFLWWYGNKGPHEPPADPSRRCTTPTEGLRVCVQAVAFSSRDWWPLMQTLLEAQPSCGSRSTDEYELRLQIFDKRYRESEVCGPIAEKVGKLFETLSPHETGK